jgi:rhodanese-related sulfurtransferase/rubrerythrin
LFKIADIFTKVDAISADEARKLIADKSKTAVEVVDVREPAEYREKHLPGALLLPLSGLPDNMHKLNADGTVITYCRAGVRSRSAAALLKRKGFREVYSITGGIDAWNGLVSSGEYEAGMFLLEGKKTAEELISLAGALEDGAKRFYEEAKDLASDDDSKKLFDLLIRAEEKHKEVLLKSYSRVRGDEPGDTINNESSTGFMESGVSVKEAVDWLKQDKRTTRDIFELSMQIEANSLDFYMKMLREIEDADAKKTIAVLIEEEKAHLSRLGRMLETIVND